MRRPSVVIPAGIAVATVAAAVVELVAGGPDRGALAMALLIGVPLLIAIGSGSDHAWRTMPPPENSRTSLLAVAPAVLLQTAALAVMVWQVGRVAADGDAADAAVLVPLAMVVAWRVREIGRRLRPGPPPQRRG